MIPRLIISFFLLFSSASSLLAQNSSFEFLNESKTIYLKFPAGTSVQSNKNTVNAIFKDSLTSDVSYSIHYYESTYNHQSYIDSLKHKKIKGSKFVSEKVVSLLSFEVTEVTTSIKIKDEKFSSTILFLENNNSNYCFQMVSKKKEFEKNYISFKKFMQTIRNLKVMDSVPDFAKNGYFKYYFNKDGEDYVFRNNKKGIEFWAKDSIFLYSTINWKSNAEYEMAFDSCNRAEGCPLPKGYKVNISIISIKGDSIEYIWNDGVRGGINTIIRLYPNLVPNGSFEEMDFCPDSNFLEEYKGAKYWYNPTASTPNFFNRCVKFCENAPSFSVPDNFVDYLEPKMGNGYSGIYLWELDGDNNITKNYREFISVKLKNKLEKNVNYCFCLNYCISKNSKFATPEVP
ncbi:MAG: hypothetical protein V2A54_05525, partial [Bacteroidota bacterium]